MVYAISYTELIPQALLWNNKQLPSRDKPDNWAMWQKAGSTYIINLFDIN